MYVSLAEYFRLPLANMLCKISPVSFIVSVLRPALWCLQCIFVLCNILPCTFCVQLYLRLNVALLQMSLCDRHLSWLLLSQCCCPRGCSLGLGLGLEPSGLGLDIGLKLSGFGDITVLKLLLFTAAKRL